MDLNKKIYNAVFNSPGFSADLSLNSKELDLFKACIENQFLHSIANLEPSIKNKFIECGIENYHEASHLINHSAIWSKYNRCLPKSEVSKIKGCDFIKQLKSIFGNFNISNIVYDQTVVADSEEIYWRLVRPGVASDVGSLHADKWFHEVLSSEYIPEGVTSLKVWIPIYCEPGKNGLLIVPDSHKKEWKHSFLTNSSGQIKPVIEDKPMPILINTPPGNMIIFPDGTLHGGALNNGLKTRVSAEITLLLTTSNSI
jgi:Phytanoyl-CoA dioxygenase (PhyH)